VAFATGILVQFVRVPDVGVPNSGVTSVGLTAKTTPPDPVEDVTPVPPLATGSAVPEYERVSVPLPVTGLPVTVKIEGADNPTEVTVPPPPPPEYWGIFNVVPLNVAAPEVPTVVSVIVPCLLLNVVQFADVR
jgi:hypothetical protein